MENSNPNSEYFELGSYFAILKRHWLGASSVFVSVFLLIFLALLLQPKLYQAKAKLLVKSQSSTASITGLGQEIGERRNLSSNSSPLETEAEKILSVPMLQEMISTVKLFEFQKEDVLTENEYQKLLKKISVKPMGNSDILEIAYLDTDPQRAATVVNSLVNIYLQKNQELNHSEAVIGREFLQKQLPEAKKNVQQLEDELRLFKEKNQIIALEQEATSGVITIDQLQERMSQLESDLADNKAQFEAVQNQLGMNLEQAVKAITITQSPQVQNVLQELQKIETELELQRTTFTPENVVIIDLEEKLKALQALLNERLKDVTLAPTSANNNQQIGALKQELTSQLVQLQAKRLGLLSQIAALSQEKSAYRKRLNGIPQLEQQQRELERKLQVAQSTYTSLLQKIEEIKIEESQNLANASFISPALVPEEPAAPNEFLYFVSGVLLASVLSFATAMVLDANDKSVKTIDQVNKHLGFPLLGIIPLSTGKIESNFSLDKSIPEIFLRNNSGSFITQCYRMLQTNLRLRTSSFPGNVIVVTSSVSREGTSTVVANLGMAIAQTGMKVLLVDGNLHQPSLHKIWAVSQKNGLTKAIGEKSKQETMIVKVTDNLDLMPTGQIYPYAIDFLENRQKIDKMLDLFSQSYDYVLIDTSPVTKFMDSMNFASLADGILLVVRPDLLNHETMNIVKYTLESSEHNVLGTVVNGINFPSEFEQFSFDPTSTSQNYIESPSY